jgi:predicted amidohydrolase
MALSLESPAIGALAKIAARHRLLLSVGLLEDAGAVLFNTQILVGSEGLLATWRKMHVPMFEMPFYNPGPAVCAASTPLGRLGANICFDVLLPESTRLLAIDGAEIILMPFAADPPPCTPEGWAQWAGAAIRARAVENGVYAVACNYVGQVELAGVEQRFPGGAMIVSPRGETLTNRSVEVGGSRLEIATLTAEDLARARSEVEYLFRFRRPEIYGPLAEPLRP